MELEQLKNITDGFSASPKMPVVFVGHGHPLNAILDNEFTRALTNMGKQFEKPNAILMISAHWQTAGTYISTNPAPHTIYDFGRFDDRLFRIKYEPKGAPELAREVIQTVQGTAVREHPEMGLDHGAWTILKYIFPKADVPVFEMSIDYSKPPSYHFELGKEMQKLREKGVLIMSSGNIVHNLQMADWYNMDAKPAEWNVEFDQLVRKHLESRNFKDLINYQDLGLMARLSIPTNDHYLPMMYTLGLADPKDPIHQLYEGYQNATVSMRAFQIG